jgi:cob(I)alamin adenosyltransferase
MTGSIYTGSGDEGETSLAGGGRASKDSAHIEVYGALDEANSQIGLARSIVDDAFLDRTLAFVQHRLFACAAGLSCSGAANGPSIEADDVRNLERLIDWMTERTGEFDGFVLPGGTESAARLHVSRTVVRRAERALVALDHEHDVRADVMAFVNRLSDLLFAAARYANAVSDAPDVPWDPDAKPPHVV